MLLTAVFVLLLLHAILLLLSLSFVSLAAGVIWLQTAVQCVWFSSIRHFPLTWLIYHLACWVVLAFIYSCLSIYNHNNNVPSVWSLPYYNN